MNKLLSLFVFILLGCYVAARGQHNTPLSFKENSQQLYFIENVGQITDQYGMPRPDVQYKVSTPGMGLYIGNGQLHYQWIKTQGSTDADKQNNVAQGAHTALYRMDVQLAGANTNAAISTAGPTEYFEQYTGKPNRIAHSVRKIIYANVYPHIDWVLYIKDNKVEYDFVVHEGGNVQDIQLQYGGATTLSKTPAGGFTATTPMGTVTEMQPYAYVQNTQQAIPVSFYINGSNINFTTVQHKGTVIIDPTLVWSTYYGSYNFEQANAVACDTAGNVYFAGSTISANNIATTGAYQATLLSTSLGCSFVAKFNSAGTRLWGTYFGTAPTATAVNNAATAVACDRQGNVYIAGNTSDTFITATSGAYQAANNGLQDGYVAKLISTGALQWATYYGGSGNEYVNGVACDMNSNVFVTGSSSSTSGITTTGSNQASNGGGWMPFW